jgi:hypothetical protein
MLTADTAGQSGRGRPPNSPTRATDGDGARLELVRGSDDRRAALRSAIFAEDGRRVVALSKGLRGEVLQLGGDGLLLALARA